MQPSYFPPVPLPHYSLLDSGDGEKLERVGGKVLRRPDPQALWKPHLSPDHWQGADATFVRESDRGGRWVDRKGKNLPKDKRWQVELMGGRFWVMPTAFKHIGVFPEQASNWQVVADLRADLGDEPKLLNLFGYTGVASVLAAKAGYHVTHVDASRQSIAWMEDNLAASEVPASAVRWVLDDALGFAAREVRRGSRYQVILLDPPHYGRGPKGQKWQLEEGLAPLVQAALELLADPGLLILSTYAVGYSPLAFANMLQAGGTGRIEAGELVLPELGSSRLLPAGFCARFWRGGQA
ncbi:MAG: SAM-dependent methyltransferase [Planctomycetota bacterium]